METVLLKEEVRKIEMPEVMKKRIVLECMRKAAERNQPGYRLRPSVLLASFLLCFALAGTGALAFGKLQGYFRDRKNPVGAVTGTVYEDADDEIAVSAEYRDGSVIAVIEFMDPDAFPYRELEMIRITEYIIRDEAGKEIKGKESQPVQITAGTAEIVLPEAGRGSVLVITEMEGMKKADAPLVICGHWECPVTPEQQ